MKRAFDETGHTAPPPTTPLPPPGPITLLHYAVRHAFLSWLATDQNVSASTQNQALGALLFLYRHVLDDPLPWLKDVVRATRPLRLPVVMTAEEVRRVLSRMTGAAHLVALLLYGAGLRLLEGLMLRIKDVDFERGQIHVRDPKGSP